MDTGTALGIRFTGRGTVGRVVRIVLYLLVVAIFVLPFWSMLATVLNGAALKTGQLKLWPSDPTLDNLRDSWNLGVGRGLANSLIVVTVGLTLQVSVSALAAYALARKRFRGAAIVTVIILATMMMPEEIIALPLFLTLGEIPNPLTGGNLVNSYGGLILPLVGWAMPIFVLTGFMRTIPVELEEAARVDGAGELRIFLRVILPLCKPALGTCAVFGFLMIWDQYLLPLLVALEPSRYTLSLVLTSLQSAEDVSDAVRLGAALITLIPSVIVYLLLQRFFERGLLGGSLKG